MTQQKLAELMTRACAIFQGCLPTTHQGPEGFVGFIRDPNGGQFPGSQQSGQLTSVSLIGLDSVRRPSGNQTRGHHLTIEVQTGQEPIEPIATRPSFVAEQHVLQRAPGPKSAIEPSHNHLVLVRDPSEHLRVAASKHSHGRQDRILMRLGCKVCW